MFKMFGNKNAGTETSQYSPDIQQIHNEFSKAAEILYQEAIGILTTVGEIPEEKAKRLQALGFTKVAEVIEVKEKTAKAAISKETIALIDEYRRKYPLNKFITLEQVNQICGKYGLVHGELSRFKGFVPEKNLLDIEKFNKNYPTGMMGTFRPYMGQPIIGERLIELTGVTFYTPDRPYQPGYSHIIDPKNDNIWLQQTETNYDGVHFYGHVEINGKRIGGNFTRTSYEIAAPVKDFDMTGMEVKDYKIVQMPTKDPVVLRPVKGGYIIVTAWGDEASDPLVVNQINN